MAANDVAFAVLLLAGAFFFVAGACGVLRFPDVFTRIHAVTKADNVGLGLVVAGLFFQVDGWVEGIKLLLVWLLVLLASATAAHLVARTALRKGLRPWKAT